jgi:hypothetical protein
MLKRLLLLFATVAAVAALVPATASASTPVTVSIFGCAFGEGGHHTVPADSTITFRGGWVTKTRGQITDFLKAVSVSASVNGSAVSNTASYWGPVSQVTSPDGLLWGSFWTYPTGITLQSGDSLTFTTEWVTSRPTYDGFAHNPAGSLFGTASCTVTAS